MAEVTGKSLSLEEVSPMKSSKPPTSKNHNEFEIMASIQTTTMTTGKSTARHSMPDAWTQDWPKLNRLAISGISLPVTTGRSAPRQTTSRCNKRRRCHFSHGKVVRMPATVALPGLISGGPVSIHPLLSGQAPDTTDKPHYVRQRTDSVGQSV